MLAGHETGMRAPVEMFHVQVNKKAERLVTVLVRLCTTPHEDHAQIGETVKLLYAETITEEFMWNSWNLASHKIDQSGYDHTVLD